ncbi:hypothetical protein CPC08DRAFT_704697 [Agrocybe pediades]|nr:hypothetical protein CPC08DRAFT_704697 [Agrocybe pediades]
MKIHFLHIASVATLFSPSLAQTSFLYKWQFQDTSIQQTIPTCQPLNIIISSFDTTTNKTKGSPPYYMTAFAVDGVSTTTLIGTTDDNAKYTVTYPVDTQLLLSVTDSQGNPGGTFAPMKVTAGQSTSCVTPTQDSSDFTVKTNITSEISTCDPLGLTITGGTSPYTVALVPSNSPATTNVTLPAGDNLYTYINRASPGGQLVVAVSDSKGNWASTATIFETKGTTDTTCNNLVSSSSKSVGGSQPANSSSGSASSPASSKTETPGSSPTSSASSSNNSSNGSDNNSDTDHNQSKGNSIVTSNTIMLAACVAVGSFLL